MHKRVAIANTAYSISAKVLSLSLPSGSGSARSQITTTTMANKLAENKKVLHGILKVMTDGFTALCNGQKQTHALLLSLREDI